VHVLWHGDGVGGAAPEKESRLPASALYVVDRALLHGDIVRGVGAGAASSASATSASETGVGASAASSAGATSASETTSHDRRFGTVVETQTLVDVLVKSGEFRGEIVRGVKATDLDHINPFRSGTFVVQHGWLGRVSNWTDDVILEFAGGATCQCFNSTTKELVPCSDSAATDSVHDRPVNADNTPFFYPNMTVRLASDDALGDHEWLTEDTEAAITPTEAVQGVRARVSNVFAGEAHIQWIAQVAVTDDSRGGPYETAPPDHVVDPAGLLSMDKFAHTWWNLNDHALVCAGCVLRRCLDAHLSVDSGVEAVRAGDVQIAREVVAAQTDPVQGRVAAAQSSSISAASSSSSSSSHENQPQQHASAAEDNQPHTSDAVEIIGLHTFATVCWTNGTEERDVPSKSLALCEGSSAPGPNSFFPNELVYRKDDEDGESERGQKISASTVLGSVMSFDPSSRMCRVKWFEGGSDATNPSDSSAYVSREEDLSAFELTLYRDFCYRVGDVVALVAPDEHAPEMDDPTEEGRAVWVGQIESISEGRVIVEWLNRMISEVLPQDLYLVLGDPNAAGDAAVGGGGLGFAGGLSGVVSQASNMLTAAGLYADGGSDGATGWINSLSSAVASHQSGAAMMAGDPQTNADLQAVINGVKVVAKFTDVSGHGVDVGISEVPDSTPGNELGYIPGLAFMAKIDGDAEATPPASYLTFVQELSGHVQRAAEGMSIQLGAGINTEVACEMVRAVLTETRLPACVVNFDFMSAAMNAQYQEGAGAGGGGGGSDGDGDGRAVAASEVEVEDQLEDLEEEEVVAEAVAAVTAGEVEGKTAGPSDVRDAASSQSNHSAAAATTAAAAAAASSGGHSWTTFSVRTAVPSDHFYLTTAAGATGASVARRFTKRVQKEWKLLRKNLPPNMTVLGYESRMDLMRAVMVGPHGTPYADCLFVFDIELPVDKYPLEPPKVHFWSFGERLNPNLYESGKVCLSLLGTWSGDQNEQWNPAKSSILQVLVSLQALVLVDEPYFNEPGHETDRGTEEGTLRSKQYCEHARLLSLRSVIRMYRRPPAGLEEIVRAYFDAASVREVLLREEAEVLEGGSGGSGPGEVATDERSSGFLHAHRGVIARIRAAFDADVI
jgi:ubiquitin-protein ligase